MKKVKMANRIKKGWPKNMKKGRDNGLFSLCIENKPPLTSPIQVPREERKAEKACKFVEDRERRSRCKRKRNKEKRGT